MVNDDKQKLDLVIVTTMFIMIGVLLGFAAGHILYDDYAKRQYKFCVDKFEECKTRFNSECMFRERPWENETFGLDKDFIWTLEKNNS